MLRYAMEKDKAEKEKAEQEKIEKLRKEREFFRLQNTFMKVSDYFNELIIK